ncbi:hypothetical protein CCASP_04795 [Corynebacterium caspium DSM 44850]|nr:hypothetical protein CCASP_04795 [Corynebacterium caspium DSM 44850]
MVSSAPLPGDPIKSRINLETVFSQVESLLEHPSRDLDEEASLLQRAHELLYDALQERK